MVIHAEGDQVCPVENGRFLARTLSNAHYVEVGASDHVRWFDPDATIGEVRGFLTGRREGPLPDAFLAIFDRPARAIRCALAVIESTQSLGLDV